jgi:hypothetical protein
MAETESQSFVETNEFLGIKGVSEQGDVMFTYENKA